MSHRSFPYGYRMEKGRIVICEEEAGQIRRIFENRLNHMGVYAIGKGLYERQVPFFADSRDKSIKKVSAILYKSIYIGDKGYPPIIDRETFQIVQDMKAAAFRKSKTKVVPEVTPHAEYEINPTEKTASLEAEILRMIGNHTADSTEIREMIFKLADEKYQTIKEKGTMLCIHHQT